VRPNGHIRRRNYPSAADAAVTTTAADSLSVSQLENVESRQDKCEIRLRYITAGGRRDGGSSYREDRI